ncbi:unnamed protein product [Candidula unifasciata]|uniref:RCC1-like domain-containing protein n=1 Tax=Candidula unifasciata TaxID=100452 RepID=A0A8S3ZYR5_9EUPU|nr:unnamed protein product [Candidula unifasciata]
MAVYTWGLGKTGQLGTGRLDTEYTPHLANKTADGLELETAKDISCGALFTAVVTVDGSVFTTGYGKYGRLGLGDTENDACFFTEVSSFGQVSQVSCGSWHAAAVTDSGQVYIWGYKKACGDCLLLDSTTVSQTVGSMLGNPTLVPFDVGVKIAGVSCGHNYTFLWATNGNVYSWGSGHYGVLGHGSEDDLLMPTKVEHLLARAVVSVGAGHDHCGIVTHDGLLFMTGKGSDGALGLGSSKLANALLPILCRCQWKITAVSCSKGEQHAHTLALTEEGQVLSWGDGCKGKLGLGDEEKRLVPTLISPEHFHNETVKTVSAGGIHSAAATTEGSVYTWGCGSDGRLGHPEGHRYLFRSKVPKKVEQLPKTSAGPVLVSSGYYHTAAIVP